MRGLPAYYSSFSRTTSLLDKWMTGRAIHAFPDQGAPDAITDVNRRAYAAHELRRLLLAGAASWRWWCINHGARHP